MERLIRILIVEDQRVVGQGLAELLGGQDGLVIVGREETIGRAVDVLSVCKPDVVLSDVMFGTEPDGLELARRVRAMRGPPVVFLSSYGEPWLYATAVAAGASGYVLKTTGIRQLTAAIRAAVDGQSVFPTSAISAGTAAPRPPSPREREIIELVSEGRANREIAAYLDISDKTVESHLVRLYERYRVSGRTELATVAVRMGWVRGQR